MSHQIWYCYENTRSPNIGTFADLGLRFCIVELNFIVNLDVVKCMIINLGSLDAKNIGDFRRV